MEGAINILKKDCKILIGPKYNIIDCNNQKIIKKNRIINLVFYNGGGGNLRKIYNIIKYLLDHNPEISNKVKLTIVLGPMSVKKDIIYEPSKTEIVKSLVPKYFNTQIWQYMLESFASEQAARMLAMENATENA